MKIFLSHSSKDEEIANKLKEFLESISTEINVFCSSSFEALKPGNFVRKIESELIDCNQFIVLLSENYVNSTYSLIELGFAYSRLVRNEKITIISLTLPGGENLLDNTPLRDIQHYPLLDVKTLKMLENVYRDSGIECILITNERILSFLKKDLTSLYVGNNDIFAVSDIKPVCSDPSNPGAIKCNKSNDSVEVTYNLYINGNSCKPAFISTVFNFYNVLNLYDYYKAKNDLILHFEIDSYTSSIKQLQIEFQTVNNRGIGHPFIVPLNERHVSVNIPISNYAKYGRDLNKIINICFVVLIDSFIEVEGNYAIRNLRFQ